MANLRRKGRELVQIFKKLLEAQGALVEAAPQQVVWIGRNKPIAKANDYFGLWDLVVVHPEGRRYFVQVTTEAHLSDRRKKIIDAKFPCTSCDLIVGHRSGSAFRVLFGPEFKIEESEEWGEVGGKGGAT